MTMADEPLIARAILPGVAIVDPGQIPRLVHRLRSAARPGRQVSDADLVLAADTITQLRRQIRDLEAAAILQREQGEVVA